MPRTTTVDTWTGEAVSVEVDDGKEYRRRVELSVDDSSLLYGVDCEDGEPVADFLASYQNGDLVGIGADGNQPEWANAELTELEITEVRV